MTPETNDPSIEEAHKDLEARADRMEERVEELGEHAEEADKKAEATRKYTSPDADEQPMGETAGDWDDVAPAGDDPSGSVDEPRDDDS
jgi:hypothetical protein